MNAARARRDEGNGKAKRRRLKVVESPGRLSLKLADISDRELLALMVDVGDNEGYVTTLHLVTALNLQASTDKSKPGQCVGSRLSWLRRYGVVERDPEKGWRLTRVGRALCDSRLRAVQTRAFNELDADQLMIAAQAVGERFRSAGPEARQMMRREWQYQTGTR